MTLFTQARDFFVPVHNVYLCHYCDGILRSVGSDEVSSDERAGHAKVTTRYGCLGCSKTYSSVFRESFSGGDETWWLTSLEPAAALADGQAPRRSRVAGWQLALAGARATT